jgi:hypothetical protein
MCKGVKAEPKDLKVGETYLLINNKTNEKTVASYKSYSEDEFNDFFYNFEDKDGEIEIKANKITNSDNSDDISNSDDLSNSDDTTNIDDPYSSLLLFDTNFSVYIPQTKKNMKKILENKLPEDVSKEITSYLKYGGKTKKKSKKTKKIKKNLKKIKKSKKRCIKKTIKSKKKKCIKK